MIIKFKTCLRDKTLPPNPIQISCTLCVYTSQSEVHVSAYQLWYMQCYRVQGEGCQKSSSFPIAPSQNQTPPPLKQAAHDHYSLIHITSATTYCRLGFDCKILMIANCEFFWSSQSKESQSILERITTIRYRVNYHNH